MCGIAGQMVLGQSGLLEETELGRMLDLLHHRGPEGNGKYIDANIMLGQARLSFIDLENGWQPLYNEDKSVVMCCNGEVYNYVELREELLKKGHTFRTKSDCEMIPHLYEEYGLDFPNKINGMFAISIWDKRSNTLVLCRDRVGRCPLYYSIQNGKLYFASEIKSIVACSGIRREANVEALDSLLTFNYIPNELTAFNGIYKIEPGQIITINLDGHIEKSYYWTCKSNAKPVNDVSFDEAIYEIERLLSDATRIRLRSDVPVGAFLSGGIDSSIVLANASDFNKHIQTFSIGFQEDAYNELPYAEEVAKQFETNHIEEIVSPDFFSLLPTTIWHNDEPHGDVSFLPMYVLAGITSKHVKTVLTGDGSDEIFGGYSKYLGFLKNIPSKYSCFYEDNSVFSHKMKMSLYTDEFRTKTVGLNPLLYIDNLAAKFGMDPVCRNNADILNPLLYLETRILLDGNNLIKTDRMGMGNSIEGRMPFLDYRMVDFVMGLPSKYKIYGEETKHILKIIAAKRLSENIVYRKKQMFTVPIGEWFKTSLKDTAYDILLDERTVSRNLFRVDAVKEMLDAHISGKKNYTRQLRLLIVIELWYRIYIDNLFSKAPKLEDILR